MIFSKISLYLCDFECFDVSSMPHMRSPTKIDQISTFVNCCIFVWYLFIQNSALELVILKRETLMKPNTMPLLKSTVEKRMLVFEFFFQNCYSRRIGFRKINTSSPHSHCYYGGLSYSPSCTPTQLCIVLTKN